MSAPAHPPPARVTTHLGDVGCLTYEPLDPAAIEHSVRSAQAGAVVSFVGYTRDEFQGKRVTHLEYEAYTPLALKTLRTILDQVRQLPSSSDVVSTPCCPPRTPSDHDHDHSSSDHPVPSPTKTKTLDLTRVVVYHLLGTSPVLTPSIVVCVSAPHRKDAFVGCEWVLEQVKLRVQVWKREWYDDQTTFVGFDGQGQGKGQGQQVSSGEAQVTSIERHQPPPVWKENFPVDTSVSGKSARSG